MNLLFETHCYAGVPTAGTPGWHLTGARRIFELPASYSRYDTDISNADCTKLALGYGYNLSKRTQVSNANGAQRSIGVQGLAAPVTALGGTTALAMVQAIFFESMELLYRRLLGKGEWTRLV